MSARRRVWLGGLAVLVVVVVGAAVLVLTVPKGTAQAGSTGPSATPATTVARDPSTGAAAGTAQFDTCEGCHPDYRTKPPTTPGLIFSHQTHLARNAPCQGCHRGDLAHNGAPRPGMASCFACHEGRRAPKDCPYCHSNLAEIAPGLGQTTVHMHVDAADPQTCDGCHERSFCDACHGLSIPHPADWVQVHGQPALSDPLVCAKCHEVSNDQFCVRCHGLLMPHPVDWVTTHGSSGAGSQQTCVKCHAQPAGFCDPCHKANGVGVGT